MAVGGIDAPAPRVGEVEVGEEAPRLLRRRDLHAHVHGVEVNVGELAVAGARLRLREHETAAVTPREDVLHDL